MEKSIFLPDHFRVDNRSIGKDRTAQKREATSAADTNYKLTTFCSCWAPRNATKRLTLARCNKRRRILGNVPFPKKRERRRTTALVFDQPFSSLRRLTATCSPADPLRRRVFSLLTEPIRLTRPFKLYRIVYRSFANFTSLAS